MKEKALIILISIITLFSCSSESYDISSICLRDEVGNYIIKWETNPVLEGTAKIYVSDVPGDFKMDQPVLTAPIKKGIVRYITKDNINRRYFRITFNGRYPQDVAARYTDMEVVQNFRDVGGYKNRKGKSIKWGHLFRSGTISGLSQSDSIRIRKLGIKTIIDLRSDKEVWEKPLNFAKVNIIQIPIPSGNKTDIFKRIQENKVRKRDGTLFMEDTYIRFIINNTEEYADAFHLLLDEDNYPILVTGDLGKDRVGLFVSLLFKLLDIPNDVIMREYLSSSNHIDPSFMANQVLSLSFDSQETMTVLLLVKESFINIAFNEIYNRFGTFDNYRETGLKLSSKKQQKLKDILLN